MASAFDDFVKRKTGSVRNFDPADRIANWQRKVAELNAAVSSYLKKFIDEGSIVVQREAIFLHEELLGTYPIEAINISIGETQVKLKPVGTILLGGIGRADLTGIGEPVMFVLAPREATQPTVRVSFEADGDKAVKPINWDEWVWKIAIRQQGLRYIELKRETFQEALMAVAA